MTQPTKPAMLSRSPIRVAPLLAYSSLLYLLGAMAPAIAFAQQSATKVEAPRAPHRMSDEAIVSDLRAEMDRLAAEGRFSGAVLLAKDGKPLFEQAYGDADRAFNAKNNVDTKFNMASTAKLFTATSILQLAQQGKLSLDDTLLKVLPDYPNKDIAGKITVRQILMHRSGLGSYVGEEGMETNPYRLKSMNDYVPFFSDKPLLFEPGTKYSYSNTGMFIMGLVVEHLSGQRFEDYVREHIFKPAGMTDTGYYTSEDDIPNLALGYKSQGLKPGEPRKITLHLGRGAGAVGSSGTYTTVGDLVRFAEAIKGGKLLNREYTNLLMKYKPVDTTKEQYHAFGWEHRYVNGVHIAGHWGAGPGTNTDLWVYPDLGYTVAVLANYESAANLVAKRLETRLTGQKEPQAVQLPAEALKQFEGNYISAGPLPPGVVLMSGPPGSAPANAAGGGQQALANPSAGGGASNNAPGGPRIVTADRRPAMEIVSDREGLQVSYPQAGKHEYLPMSPSEFFDADTLAGRLVFTKNDKGEVTGVTETGSSFSYGTATAIRKFP